MENVLSQLKCHLGDEVNTHYCLMKKVDENDFEDLEVVKYKKIKQKLKINDLKRYFMKMLIIKP